MINFIYYGAIVLMLPFASLSAEEPSIETPGDNALLAEIFVKRHSGENFQQTPLSDEQVQTLIQAARWSPSSYNDQPWNFIFCDFYKDLDSHQKVVDSIYGQEWVENVPLFAVVLARDNFLYNQELNEWADYDTGAAAMSMSLAATDMGLMAHQIGGFDKEQIIEDFDIPEGFRPIAIIAIGYEADNSENALRTRRPVKENFFFGRFAKPDADS